MKSTTLSWFKRNALVLFFILAYAISWSFMIPIALSVQGWVSWQVPTSLYYFAPFGPMIAAVIMTAITDGGQGVRKL